MKNFLKYIFLFFFASLIIDRCLNYIINNQIVFKSNFRYTRYLKEKPDVIILGNSRAVHSINEKLWDQKYSLDLIDLSFNGMSPKAINIMVDGFKNTNDIILGIEISSYYTWAVNDSVNDIFSLNEINNDIYSNPYNVNPHFRLYRKYYSSFNNHFNENDNLFYKAYSCLNFNNSMLPYLIKYIYKDDRSWVMNEMIGKNQIENLKNINFIKLHFHEKLFADLLDILEKKQFKKVFFYEAPWQKDYLKKIYNYQNVQEKIRYYDLAFSNLNDFFPKDDKYHADYLHMNIQSHDMILDYINTTFINSK